MATKYLFIEVPTQRLCDFENSRFMSLEMIHWVIYSTNLLKTLIHSEIKQVTSESLNHLLWSNDYSCVL